MDTIVLKSQSNNSGGDLLLTECRRLPGLDDEQLLAADNDMDAREPKESRPRGVATSTSEDPVRVDTWNKNNVTVSTKVARSET